MGLMVNLSRKPSLESAAVDALRNGRVAEAQRYLDTAVGKSGGGGLAASAAAQSVARAASTPQVLAANTYTGSTSPMSNGLGVRSMLNQAGVDNSRIGWNGQSVTVDGRVFGTPDSVVDGTSYMSKDNFQKNYNALANAGRAEQTQAATDWAAGKGVNNAVQWLDNGQASVFGRTMTPLYMTDSGKAIFRTSDLEDAYNAWKSDNNYLTGADVFSQTQDKYGRMTDRALRDVLDRDEWSYDPEDDEAYRAYRDQYTREGNRALEDAVAAQSGATGGYMNSAALTAGGQAQNYYMQQLADRIPELQAQSYDRYVNEDAMRRAALQSVINTSDDYYNKLYNTALQDREYINNAFDREYARDVAEREWSTNAPIRAANEALANQAVQSGEYDNVIKQAEAAYAPNNAYLKNQSLTNEVNAQGAAVSAQEYENDLAKWKSIGYIPDEDADKWGIARGTSPFGAEAAALQMSLDEMAAKDYYSARADQRNYTYNSALQGEKYGYESDQAYNDYLYDIGKTREKNRYTAAENAADRTWKTTENAATRAAEAALANEKNKTTLEAAANKKNTSASTVEGAESGTSTGSTTKNNSEWQRTEDGYKVNSNKFRQFLINKGFDPYNSQSLQNSDMQNAVTEFAAKEYPKNENAQMAVISSLSRLYGISW